jgi:hypothetical protein
MTKKVKQSWFKETTMGKECTYDTHCSYCKPDGDCDSCNTVDGRWIEEVCEYASTCDGPCMELTHHDLLCMDPVTQLGYCSLCIPKLPKEIRNRLQNKEI